MHWRWGAHMVRRHAITSAVMILLLCLLAWRLRIPLLSNIANLYWLRSVLAGPDLAALAQSDRLTAVAERWSGSDPSMRFQRGILAWERGDKDAALAYWQANADDRRLALYIRAREQVGQGYDISQAVAESSTGFHTLYACLHVLERCNVSQPVLEIFDRIKTAWPDWEQRLVPGEETAALTYLRMAEANTRLDDHERALAYYFEARERYEPEMRWILDGPIGNTYFRLGQMDAAEVYLRRASQDFFASMRWGDLAFSTGRLRTALLAYRRAAELRPDDVRPWLGLVRTYEGLHQPDQAQMARDSLERLKAQAP